MKSYTIAASAASLLIGSAILSPCGAQVSVSVSDVHIEKKIGTNLETNTAQTTNVQNTTRVEVPTSITIVQSDEAPALTNRIRMITQESQALKAYTTAQAYQNFSTMYSPEMAKKTRDIALLRQMLALKLTARDIEQAIPLLRELKNVDKIVPAKPEQAMDEEYQNLLRAKPGDPMPTSSAEVLRDAASGFRSHKQAIWEKMGQEIGREKAAGIRAMLRSESNINWTSSSYNNLFTRPQTVRPRVAPQLSPGPSAVPPRAKPAPAPEPNPAAPEDPVSIAPLQDETSLRLSLAGLVHAAVQIPDFIQDAISQEQGAAKNLRSSILRSALAQAGPARDLAPEAAIVQPQEAEISRPAARAQSRSIAGQRGSTTLAPLGRTMIVDPTGHTQIFFGYYGQATIDELIDLFERKLAAMRR